MCRHEAYAVWVENITPSVCIDIQECTCFILRMEEDRFVTLTQIFIHRCTRKIDLSNLARTKQTKDSKTEPKAVR